MMPMSRSSDGEDGQKIESFRKATMLVTALPFFPRRSSFHFNQKINAEWAVVFTFLKTDFFCRATILILETLIAPLTTD